jgi:hypothetical protein
MRPAYQFRHYISALVSIQYAQFSIKQALISSQAQVLVGSREYNHSPIVHPKSAYQSEPNVMTGVCSEKLAYANAIQVCVSFMFKLRCFSRQACSD